MRAAICSVRLGRSSSCATVFTGRFEASGASGATPAAPKAHRARKKADAETMKKKLEDAGAVAIMPLGAPNGSGLGHQNRVMIRLIVENAGVPVLVDAGVGTASDASVAVAIVTFDVPRTLTLPKCR